MSVLQRHERIRILAHLVEGTGIRSTARLCGVDKTTVNKFSLDVGDGCQVLHDEYMRDLPVSLVQVDEQWSFVRKKQKRLKETDDPTIMGDQWTYVAEDVVHRAIISYYIGKRTVASARAFVTDLRARVTGRFQVTADGHKPYADAFKEVCGDTVDFAQLVKRYECDEREARGLPLGRKRYIGSERQVILGSPDPSKISTSAIERMNLSSRMEQARLARRTLRHSKDLRQHKASTALYYAYFNLVRVHDTLETTPAVALGLFSREWTLGELIDAAMDRRSSINPQAARVRIELDAHDSSRSSPSCGSRLVE
jgi:IS1 family transposase